MVAIHLRFLRVSVIYLVAGMCIGLGMGISGEHRLFPAHAHIGLVGWASFALYALVYRSFPSAAVSQLARWHFWLANAGAVLLVTGVAGINLGDERFVPLAGSGGVISIVGALVFGIILFRADSAADEMIE